MKAYQRLAEVMAQCSWNPKKKWERDTKDSDSWRAMCQKRCHRGEMEEKKGIIFLEPLYPRIPMLKVWQSV